MALPTPTPPYIQVRGPVNPEATPLEVHRANEDFTDGVWGFVEVDQLQLVEIGSEMGAQGLSR